MKRLYSAVAFFILLSSSGFAAHMVKDLTTSGPSESSMPSGMTFNGKFVLFVATDLQHGRELWRTDGTLSGTILVKDIVPGPYSSYPTILMHTGSLVFFSVSEESKSGLWRSDGTPSGTYRIANFSTAGPVGELKPGTLLFTAETDQTGFELWRTDGTAQGTSLVKDISPGKESSYPGRGVSFQSRVCFPATTLNEGNELWCSDGTAAGTVLIKDIAEGPAGSFANSLQSIGSSFLFFATDVTHGAELWRSDGTAAGTRLVKDVYPGSASGAYTYTGVATTSGKYFFIAYEPDHGNEVWVSDGSPEGTRVAKDLIHGPGWSRPYSLSAFGDRVVFATTADNAHGVWISDGTDAGTTRLADLYGVGAFTNVNGTLFFIGSFGLWKTGGSQATTVSVKKGFYGSETECHDCPLPELASGGNYLAMAADDGNGYELFRSNGTTDGTFRLHDMTPGNAGTYFQAFRAGSHIAYFQTFRTFYRSDGTAEGTFSLRDSVFDFVPDGDLCWFTSDASLWITDGTIKGTRIVKTFSPYGPSLYYSAVSKGVLYFVASQSDFGGELWRSDGTEAGTFPVKDIRPGPEGSQIADMIQRNGIIFFTADDGQHGREIWRSLGTARTTLLVKDIVPGQGDLDTDLKDSVYVNGFLYFQGSDPAHGKEPWRTDGTPSGTQMIKDIAPGKASSGPVYFKTLNNSVYFSATSQGEIKDLWKSDGTSAGTSLFFQSTSTDSYRITRAVRVFNGRLLFETYNEKDDPSLYSTDGTANILLAPIDICGSNGGAILNNVLFFCGAEEYDGELWRTDGTPNGTHLYQEIAFGPTGSYPSYFVTLGTRILFTADDFTHGQELWSEP